jgi:hypothetical protein
MRVVVVLVLLAFFAVVVAACAGTNQRTSTLGPASDSCLAAGSDCIRSSQCCTFWCANQTCATREP